MRALLSSLAICVLGVLLEGVFAGGKIRQRLAGLRVPRYSVSFVGWIVIGGLYYTVCFIVLYRLFSLSAGSARNLGLGLLGALMFINALWNYFFFRSGNLFHAYLLGLPYSAVAFTLFLLLLQLDRVAGWCLLPYILYLFYGNMWGYRVWKLNLVGTGRDER